MTTTSACAVGSLSQVTRFWPVLISSPPATITAANDLLPSCTFWMASSIVACSYSSSGDIGEVSSPDKASKRTV
jgi:hypothetical protein